MRRVRHLWLLLVLGACSSLEKKSSVQLSDLGPASGVGGARDFYGRKIECEAEAAELPRVCHEVHLAPPRDAPPGQHAVDMAVSIAADGAVSDARIIQSAGEPFDGVAKSAMAQFVFCPARDRDQRPLACKISYRYVFVR